MLFQNSSPHQTGKTPFLHIILMAVFISACNLPVTVSLVWPTPPAAMPASILPPDTATPFQPLAPTLQVAAELLPVSEQNTTFTAEPQPSAANEFTTTPSITPGVSTVLPSSTLPPTNSAPLTAMAKTFFTTVTGPKPTGISPTKTQPKIQTPIPTRANTQVLLPPTVPPSATIPPTVPPPPTTIPPTAPPPPPTAIPPSATTPPTSPPSACAASGNAGYEQTLFSLINQERANQGLSALNWQSQLATAASVHSTDMACNNFFSHTGSNGSTFDQRIRAQGYSFSSAAENLFAGGGPQDAFTAWMNSPGHRANMLNPNLQEIGIGYMYNGGTTYGGYYTANFGTP